MAKIWTAPWLPPLMWMGIALFLGRLLPNLELQTQSLFWRLRPPQTPPKEIILIAMDELSLTQGENYNSDPDRLSFYAPIQQYPWKREAYALGIERLMAAGARVVALDVLFANPSIYGEADDRILEKALQKYQDRLVLASSYEISQSQEGIVERRISPRDLFPGLDASLEGFVNLPTDRDGNIHKLPVLTTSESTFINAILTQGKIPAKPPRGEIINFLGSANTWVNAGQQYSFYFLLNPQTWAGVLENGAVFRDKIVIIGATSPSLQDIKSTPLGNMPGVEVHAHALATLLTGRSVRFLLSPWVVIAWLILCGGLLPLFPTPQYRWGGALGLATLAAVGSLLLWQGFSILLPAGRIVIATIGMGTTYLIVGTMEEQILRQKLRRTLEIYVGAPIVAEILNQPESYYALLTGKSICAAVMFSDIRGFTTLSQMLPPQTLIMQLNQYLSAMVDVVISHQGTVDKFMGDAIMAEFGSPLSQGAAQDALSAIRAALGMRRALVELRRNWRRSGQKPLFHGIGLHYGEIIVGNIGSPQRLEYAAIGDTVNTASRIEGMTKQLGYDILISEALYKLVEEQVDAIDLGQHQLRGRSATIGIYALVGLKDEPDQLFEQVRQEWQQSSSIPMLG